MLVRSGALTAGRLAALAAACLVAFGGCDEEENELEAKLEGSRIPPDPHYFRTASEMYWANGHAPPRIRPSPGAAEAAALATAAQGIAGGVAPEAQEVRQALGAIGPREFETWRAVSGLADTVALHLRGASATIPYYDLTSAADAYRVDAARGLEAYLRLVAQAPAHLDARSNLALAALHTGEWTLALLELEVLRRAAPRYVPAMVNLTVLYEVLGRVEDARALAEATVALAPSVRAAAFNASWYAHLSGDVAGAMGRLKPVLDAAAAVSAASAAEPGSSDLGAAGCRGLYDVSAKALGLEPYEPQAAQAIEPATGVWRLGVTGEYGGRSIWDDSDWTQGVGAFALASFLLAGLFAGALGRPNDDGTTFWVATVSASVWYVVVWGRPTGLYWLPLVGFALVFCALVFARIARAKRR